MHIAPAPGKVRCSDTTFSPARMKGRRFYLNLILNLYSRRIMGFEVHEDESSDHAVHLVRLTAVPEGVHAASAKPALHDNSGATLKAIIVSTTLH